MRSSLALAALGLAALDLAAARPAAAQFPAPAPDAARRTVVLRAARMIDGTGAPAVRDAAVVVVGDRITAAGPAASVAVPAGARVVDLGDATLLPGFIDAHTHIIGRSLGQPGGDDAPVRDYQGYNAILGVENARKTLMAGFTSIRNVGAPDFDDMALRQAVDEGHAVGPRMENAGHSFGITGGHCDENGFKPGLMDADYRTGAANGADEGRKAVRYQVKYGFAPPPPAVRLCRAG